MNKSDRTQLSIILAKLKRARTSLDWDGVSRVTEALEALLLEGK